MASRSVALEREQVLSPQCPFSASFPFLPDQTNTTPHISLINSHLFQTINAHSNIKLNLNPDFCTEPSPGSSSTGAGHGSPFTRDGNAPALTFNGTSKYLGVMEATTVGTLLSFILLKLFIAINEWTSKEKDNITFYAQVTPQHCSFQCFPSTLSCPPLATLPSSASVP